MESRSLHALTLSLHSPPQVCQKTGEISLLKQQLRDSQAEVARKLSEIFQLKTELRGARADTRTKDSQVEALQLALQAAAAARRKVARNSDNTNNVGADHRGSSEETFGGTGSGSSGATEDRLRAELLLERRQNEAQATAFEAERHTWQTEKEKVIRYQRELQASYLEMYHKSEALERELRELRGGRGELGVGGGGGAGGGVDGGSLDRCTVDRGRDLMGEDELPAGLPWIERIESSEI